MCVYIIVSGFHVYIYMYVYVCVYVSIYILTYKYMYEEGEVHPNYLILGSEQRWSGE